MGVLVNVMHACILIGYTYVRSGICSLLLFSVYIYVCM